MTPGASDERGWLAIVATPIGNLEDLSPRAVRVLREAEVVLAEDTRRTRSLLGHLGLEGKRLERLDAHVERRSVERLVGRLCEGQRMALVSDAGTPGVSDPGAVVVRAAADASVPVVAIPGASAVLTALAASGMPADRFRFFGFLPRKGGARRRMLEELSRTAETAVLYEAPTRIAATLVELAASMPEREAVVARELTKLHEELVRGRLSDLAAGEREWRGEITLVLGPYQREEAADDEAIDARIEQMLAEGHRAKDIAQAIAVETGISARELYARVLRHRAGG